MLVTGCVSKCDSLVYLVHHSFLIIFQLSTLYSVTLLNPYRTQIWWINNAMEQSSGTADS